MRGSSRTSARAVQETFQSVLDGQVDRARLGEDLFGITDALDGTIALRRAVSDPSRDGADKAGLVEKLFGGKVSPEAVVVAKKAAGQRWAAERDLTDTLESLAVASVVAAAEAEAGRPDGGRPLPLRADRRRQPRPARRTDRPSGRRREQGVPRRLAARGQGQPGGGAAGATGRPLAARPPVRPGAGRLPRGRVDPTRPARRHRHHGRRTRRGAAARLPRPCPATTPARRST